MKPSSPPPALSAPNSRPQLTAPLLSLPAVPLAELVEKAPADGKEVLKELPAEVLMPPGLQTTATAPPLAAFATCSPRSKSNAGSASLGQPSSPPPPTPSTSREGLPSSTSFGSSFASSSPLEWPWRPTSTQSPTHNSGSISECSTQPDGASQSDLPASDPSLTASKSSLWSSEPLPLPLYATTTTASGAPLIRNRDPWMRAPMRPPPQQEARPALALLLGRAQLRSSTSRRDLIQLRDDVVYWDVKRASVGEEVPFVRYFDCVWSVAEWRSWVGLVDGECFGGASVLTLAYRTARGVHRFRLKVAAPTSWELHRASQVLLRGGEDYSWLLEAAPPKLTSVQMYEGSESALGAPMSRVLQNLHILFGLKYKRDEPLKTQPDAFEVEMTAWMLGTTPWLRKEWIMTSTMDRLVLSLGQLGDAYCFSSEERPDVRVAIMEQMARTAAVIDLVIDARGGRGGRGNRGSLGSWS